ncbi:F-box protein At4g18380-like [Rhododendron vialii]|uniref:F-box protein At4g18380-like n=1 Tax=Rhododendron vialii TaxID=182163 RepID=UPI002660576B|nr:F-box protein At4g18380-like [Rhododendron vialii]
MAFQENEETDQFDRLPDAILRVIFNKLRDARSLTRSMSVCKRFAEIIPENDTVSLTIPRRIALKRQPQPCNDLVATKSSCSGSRRESGGSPTDSKSVFKSLIHRIVTTPIRFILRGIFSSKSSRFGNDDGADCPFYSPNEVLKNFKEIQSLRIEIPTGEIGSGGRDSLLRWRAEFGSELQSCVIFGAKSLRRTSRNPNDGKGIDEQGQLQRNRSEDEVLIGDDELKLRIVWAISCLISASARHYLLQRVVSEHLMVRRVVIGDGSKQGMVRMEREQIEELRKNVDLEAEAERRPVPALNMKLWYVKELEVREGWVVEGATVLVIRPAEEGEKKKAKEERDCDLVSRVWNGGGEEEEEAEERVVGEAVREMMKKKRACTLEMNSF